MTVTNVGQLRVCVTALTAGNMELAKWSRQNGSAYYNAGLLTMQTG